MITERILQNFIPSHFENRSQLPIDGPYSITIHDTGNPSARADALAHAAYLQSPTARRLFASWHFTVDDTNIVQHLPLDEVGWHAGDGRRAGGGNMSSIGIEICENADGDRAVAEVLAARLTAHLSLVLPTVKEVVQHNYWTGKNCPRVLRARPNGWQGFLDMVERYKDEKTSPDAPPQWKTEAIDYFAGIDMLNSPDKWKELIDDSMPVWASFLMMMRIHQSLTKEE